MRKQCHVWQCQHNAMQETNPVQINLAGLGSLVAPHEVGAGPSDSALCTYVVLQAWSHLFFVFLTWTSQVPSSS